MDYKKGEEKEMKEVKILLYVLVLLIGISFFINGENFEQAVIEILVLTAGMVLNNKND